MTSADWTDVHEWIRRLPTWQDYIDVHRWTFTPSSFRLLLHDLGQIGLVSMQIESVSQTNDFEFYVRATVQQQAPPWSPPSAAIRQQLVREIERELGEQDGARAQREACELRGVYDSTSWRVTRPLRAASRLLRDAGSWLRSGGT